MSDLGTQLREYFDATAPPVDLEEIRTDEVWVPTAGPSTRERRTPTWAIGLALSVVFLLVAVSLVLLVPETDTSDLVNEPGPEEPVDESGLIEPAGSGPALVWDEIDLPMDSRLGWLVADDQSFYLSMTDSFEVTTDWSWFVSDDARTWTQIASYKELLGSGPPALDLEPNLAWDGKLVSVDFPTVITVDTISGQVSSRDLDFDILPIKDPCFQPEVVGAPDSQQIACEGYSTEDVDITAGPEGILIVAEAGDIPDLSVVCPDPNPACDPTQGWNMHPTGWISTDGISWTSLPQRGPFTPGTAIRVDIAAVQDGFVAIRSSHDTCEAWFTSDGFSWQQVGSIAPEECPTDPLIRWGSDAIGVPYSFSPSMQPIPLWLISSSGVSQIENEPMPPIESFGYIGAGEAGIAVVYRAGAPDSDADVGVVEYSRDGRLWSRRAIPDFPGSQVVVGSEEVVIYGSFGVDGLLVGRP
jgi:hypothetical protein